MASECTLWGDITSALDLIVPVGLVAVLDEAGLGPASFFWDADAVPSRARVSCASPSKGEMAEAVRRHAERHTQADSWVQARIQGISNAGKGLFSPRASLNARDWQEYLTQRAEWLTAHQAQLTELDWAMIAGLGEPAWWRANDRDPNPDKGASRWEMTLRNVGREFITQRFSPLAEHVAGRSADEILTGLTSSSIRDPWVAKSGVSRTSGGLTALQPVDGAKAWLALWAYSALPVIARSGQTHGGYSATPGMAPTLPGKPSSAALPIVVRPTSWRQFRALMSTRYFYGAAFDPMESRGMHTREWLHEQGVTAIAHLPAFESSANTPERYLRSATIDVLNHA